MSKLSTKLQEEFKALLPPALFFFVMLHLIALILKGCTKPPFDSLRAASNLATKASCAR